MKCRAAGWVPGETQLPAPSVVECSSTRVSRLNNSRRRREALSGSPTAASPDERTARQEEQAVHTQRLIGTLGEDAPVVHPEAWIAPGAVVVGRVRLERAASVWYGCVLRADDDE